MCVCVCVCLCVHPWGCYIIYVTGFWKTDHIVTLGLFHFIGPGNGYTCILHIHSAITMLGWLVCFTRASFANPVNSWLRQWIHGGATWKTWVWNSPQGWGDVSYAIQVCLSLWLALVGPIASPNSPNGGFNPPPASHPPPPPAQGHIQDFYNGVSISKKLQEYNNYLELALISCWQYNFTGLYAKVEDMYLCVLQTGVQSILSMLILRDCGGMPQQKIFEN